MSGEYPVVAAIDFGTHGSGFAWTVVSEDDREASQRRILFQDRWPGSEGLVYPKNLSALLLGQDGKTLAWGFDARREWRELGINGERDGQQYVSAFKMALTPERYGGAAVPGVGTVNADSPRRARPLIVAYLREIHRLALDDIMKSGYQPEHVRWCLTVPAIWDDEQQDFMRKAAAEAGMPEDGDQLLLAIEPEAAALHCQVHLAGVVGAERKRLGVTAGSRFIVVDCGGGTVDITAHRADAGPDGTVRLREITTPLGGRLGSEYINRSFVTDVLTERLGASTIALVRERAEHLLFDLVDQWEAWKVAAQVDIDPASGAPRFKRRANFPLPSELYDMLDHETKRRLAEYPGGAPHRIVVDAAEVARLFDEVIDEILRLVDKQLERVRLAGGPAPGAEQLLLVGGMARSDYLRQRLALHLGDRAKVISPVDAAVAVLFGAVHFAYDPSVIRARKARYTYGCDIHMPFEKDVDPDDKRVDTAIGLRCKDRFSVFVTRNEEVEVDRVVGQTFVPLTPDQSSIAFALYRTRDKAPRYVDEPHCKRIGEVEIDISGSLRLPFEERSVLLRMRFGDTHVKVEAVDPATQRTMATTVRFDGAY
jgi:hypothetical protein